VGKSALRLRSRGEAAVRPFKVWSIVLVIGWLVAACASASPAPTAAPAAERRLIVFAAASLTDAFEEMSEKFERQNPGVTLEFNCAGSQQLRTQLEQGAVADVFAAANTKEMNNALQAGLVISGTPQTFARNRLAVIIPRENPGSIRELKDLSKPGLKIVLAAPGVPVGGYALAALDKMNADFGATFLQMVLSNVVSQEDNVKQVVAKIQLGEGDAGIVYLSDVTPAVADKLIVLDIPDQYNVLATYPIAVLKSAPQADLAAKFVDYVLSAEGQAISKKWGFLPR
jgi:molybdate transport system substrate-binding protein